MKLGRIGPENMVIQTTGQVNATGFSANIPYYMSRSRINDNAIISWNVEFDPNWTCEEAPQRLIYWEDDNASSTTLTASLTLSAKIKIGVVEVGPGRTISYSTTIRSDDPVIWVQTYTRDEFFAGNKLSKGCGLQNGWAKYTCFEGFFTLPEHYW